MTLKLNLYTEIEKTLPTTSRYILGQYNQDSIIVYQAFNEAIAARAVRNQKLGGGGFKFDRMSWIKTGFLWMMYRSGWASKPKQERVLAIHVKRDGFDNLLKAAVHSSYVEPIYQTHENWQQQVTNSEVRLQWDPDHDPYGNKLERRAIQLGLRGDALSRYASEWTIGIEDITDFVKQQHEHVLAHALDKLLIPVEDIYPVTDSAVFSKLGIGLVI
ncbi:DUF4291 domain-containing protein [Cytophagaceae bacterium YF14B1]|uniref:DUF4291 domain-containing protein n=1 Tax=Xanthocytophaga flava TaxID=3048013 RepID=A0AAE3QMJ2_9BACT|nr:DUF4291 domain-containing protein [Xanthocytophaga flavus]MDJ1481725.1 DUF4291 domain-containing protein [Xanthocytophaga flavus]